MPKFSFLFLFFSLALFFGSPSLGSCQHSPQGRNIFLELESQSGGTGKIRIEQPLALRTIVTQPVPVRERVIPGYRVRIYRGLGRDAHAKSITIAKKFEADNPNIPAHRSYDAPYYRVAVGDCRTRIEALFLQHQLRAQYPQSFVIAEPIDFPPLCQSPSDTTKSTLVP